MTSAVRRVSVTFLALAAPALADVLRVGPHGDYPAPSAAARAARDGDTVLIEPVVYPADVAVWRANDLTIRNDPAYGDARPHLRADGANAEGKAIWVIKGARTTVEGIEFSGCRVPDRNGAGIRQEGPGLIVRGAYIHDNEMGLLTGANDASDIVVERTEFDRNGFGDGLSHNIYIGRVRSFTLRASHAHRARVGHNVKSRAALNVIEYCRIADEADGDASYLIDLPNGGLGFVIGNELHKGRNAPNSTAVSFGLEGLPYATNALFMSGNSAVSDRAPARILQVAGGAEPALLVNNIIFGFSSPPTGPVRLVSNLVNVDPLFVDRAGLDLRLRDGSPAIDAGTDPGVAYARSLAPALEYRHPLDSVGRRTRAAIDIGAHEFQPVFEVPPASR